MTVYTYWGNKDHQDGTQELDVASGKIPLGQHGDFSDAEIATLSNKYLLVLGIVNPPTMAPNTAPAVTPSSGSPGIAPWAPNTNYSQNALVIQNGILYQSNSSFKSGATFNPANWTAIGAPSELGYAEITSSSPPSPYVNSIAATGVPITGLSVTVSTGVRPIYVEVSGTAQAISNNATATSLILFEDGVEIDKTAWYWGAGQQFQGWPVMLKTRRTPTPGTHTYTVSGTTNAAANTWWMLGSNAAAGAQRSSIRVVQV